ncbi:hypothetical protein GCM10009122_03580 [Fulvivirga kasyanovii]|uniref:Uncharacterized protein n=2 Tax=Fulvivirga kasyanovii TaxID=396812 RepID=A0ABW9RRS1_9BACT|nr:hypothetical protein [Fulvivirga kasyanovii]MTI26879.1 hypothetical protein [Fulvivirga kasyanovii]
MACDPAQNQEGTASTLTTIDSTKAEVAPADTAAVEEPLEPEPEPVYSFVLHENQHVAYIKEDKIWFYDLETHEKALFPEQEEVFNLAFSNEDSVLYYTLQSGEDNSLVLYKYDLQNGGKREPLTKFQSNGPDYFITATDEERAPLKIVGDTLYLPCDYIWETFSFNSVYKFNLITQELVFASGNNPLYRLAYEEGMNNQKQFQSITERLKSVTIDNVPELFYYADGDSMQLTRTSHMERPEEYTGHIDYQISPDSSKILFSFISGFGDISHGPYMLVNTDGTNQKLLVEDGLRADSEKPLWVNSISGYAFLNEERDLKVSAGKENKLVAIDQGVSYFDVQ